MLFNSYIKEKIDEYLEFDSNLFFSPGFASGLQVSRLVRIFGGAIRDAIAEQPINDIDILCGARSYSSIRKILENNGYIYMEELIHKDLNVLYSDINVINEPHSWVKGKKVVQVINPKPFNSKKEFSKRESLYKEGFINLIKNVDISCCGVSWDGNLYENYPGAITNCLTKTFSLNKNALMYSPKRISQRKYKFESRGWRELNS